MVPEFSDYAGDLGLAQEQLQILGKVAEHYAEPAGHFDANECYELGQFMWAGAGTVLAIIAERLEEIADALRNIAAEPATISGLNAWVGKVACDLTIL
jgi:hypothetical protein